MCIPITLLQDRTLELFSLDYRDAMTAASFNVCQFTRKSLRKLNSLIKGGNKPCNLIFKIAFQEPRDKNNLLHILFFYAKSIPKLVLGLPN